MKSLLIKYIKQLLEFQETKLKCINLGYTSSNDIRLEIEIIKECKELIEKELK